MDTKDLTPILRPRSVAVIGASSHRDTIGAEILHNLVAAGFTGPVYPINPKATSVQSIRAWPDIESVPDPVDLAIIAIPKRHVYSVAEACARKGVRGLVVITAGFKETGPAGLEEETKLRDLVRSSGMVMVGPNCLGVVSTDPETRLDATFAPTFPPAGTVGVASQSGALGVAMLDYSRELNVGVSDFVSMGNKADVSGNDLLEFWEEDPRTRVIALYLESFGNPRRFAELASRIGRRKPIITVKSGRSRKGSSAASSHTGSLAAPEVAVQALVEQTGLIRVDTVEELFDMAAFLAHQPTPRGRRIGIVTNAGGPAIMATDACEAMGLEVPDLPEELRERLQSFLPEEASVSNPVDMIASAGPDEFEKATRAMLESDAIDAVLVLFVPPIFLHAEEVGQALGRAVQGADKPVISCFIGKKGIPAALAELADAHIPSYAFPESAVRVLARAVRYREHLDRPAGSLPELDVDFDEIRAMLQGKSGWLAPDDVGAVLRAIGIDTPRSVVTHSAGDAASAARRMGFPVVVKAIAKGVEHKTDVGGVRLDLRNETDVFTAWEEISDSLSSHGHELQGALVQAMVDEGVETIVGVHRDATIGTLVMFGLGGVHVELLRDVRFRMAPLTDVDASELVRSVRGFPLLDGYRGAEPADVNALEQAILRVGMLAETCPEIVELDLNPLKVRPAGRGCIAVDARLRVDR